MNADNWYVRSAAGESIGPLSETQVREMLLRATELQGTKVRQGTSAWIDASYVLKRFNELSSCGIYLAHQNQTLGPFTTEHANNLIQRHTAISRYRIGENGEWKSIDSSRTITTPPEHTSSSKPNQPSATVKTNPVLLDRELADLRLGSSIPIQRTSEDSVTRFDPYRVWLGVPKGIKRPNYYHILGIAQGESSFQVIRSAIEQRRSYVMSKRGEGHDESVHQILSLIEEAAATLLVTEFKHSYDQHVGIHLRETPRRFRKAILLPPWMESRVVRVYGEGSGLLVEVLGLVAILFGAFALMAWMSFQFPWQKITSDVATASNRGLPDPIPSKPAESDADSTPKPDPLDPMELSENASKNESKNESLSSESSGGQSSENRASNGNTELPMIMNSIGMTLIRIEPGTFIMGKGNNAHEVRLTKPFYLGVYEVTQDQYQRIMGKNPSAFKGAVNPVEEVSWNDAMEFCRKLSDLSDERKAGREYRLPTEAEREYACRAGTTTEFYFGDDETKLAEYGWFDRNSDRKPHPVGLKKPNAWGLYDMHGNVWEWCADWHGDYSKVAVTDPVGPATGSARVLRGGSWYYEGERCRSTHRGWDSPSARNGGNGFRVAMITSGAPRLKNSSTTSEETPTSQLGKSTGSTDGAWIPVFDGTTLNGWKSSGDRGAWRVENSTIVCNGQRSHLFYLGGGSFKNFHFQCEAKCSAGSNSGIYFHTRFQDQDFPKYGLECQIENTGRDLRKTGSLYGIVDVSKPAANNGQWFNLEIIVRGKRIIINVDSRTVVDYTEPSNQKPATSDFDRLIGEGTFALQSNSPGSETHFRNLQVKRLAD